MEYVNTRLVVQYLDHNSLFTIQELGRCGIKNISCVNSQLHIEIAGYDFNVETVIASFRQKGILVAVYGEYYYPCEDL